MLANYFSTYIYPQKTDPATEKKSMDCATKHPRACPMWQFLGFGSLHINRDDLLHTPKRRRQVIECKFARIPRVVPRVLTFNLDVHYSAKVTKNVIRQQINQVILPFLTIMSPMSLQSVV